MSAPFVNTRSRGVSIFDTMIRNTFADKGASVRKGTFLILLVALALGLAACGSDNNNNSGASGTTTTSSGGTSKCNSPADAYVKDVGNAKDFKPVKADTLSVVTSLPGPGFWEGSDTDPAEVKSGFEYDIAKAMQQQFGLKNLEVRNESFDAIVAGTVQNYDLALSQISITCDRAKVAKFTMPYFESNQGVLVRSDSNVKVTTLDEAKKIQWGIQTATTAADLLDKYVKPDKQPAVFQQLPDAYTALSAGQVDAVLIDTAINLGQAARSNGKLKVVSQFAQPGGPDLYGGILPKDSSNVGAVNAVLKKLKDSGELDSLAKKDLTADPGNLPTIQVG
jgi:polar amino acid transport system substrate-binding protein